MPTKYKHKDGSESILKVKHYEYDKETFEIREVKRSFVTLFVSVSSGCDYGCKMCSLTYNKKSELLNCNQMIENNKFIYNSKYEKIKISFMGMGDAYDYSLNLSFIAKQIAKDKLYGVDIGTMFPVNSLDTLKVISHLNELPNGRIFYSLHSATEETRKKLIPHSMPTNKAKEILQKLQIKKICHFTPISGLNDSNEEIKLAIKFCEDIGAQLRIIEFNKPNNFFDLEPSKRKNEINQILKASGIDYKLCYSSGKSIKASCGMFF